MLPFTNIDLPKDITAIAPDGSEVRVLARVKAASSAHFRLQPGEVSKAVIHKTVEEIWYVVSGVGSMWRRQDNIEETILLEPGVCLTIPLGTVFQFRAGRSAPLDAVGFTMPAWADTGPDEARIVDGKWTPNVRGTV